MPRLASANAAFWVIAVFCLLLVVPAAAAQGSQVDTTPPVITALSLDQTTIDISNGDVAVAVTADVTDDLSGVAEISISMWTSWQQGVSVTLDSTGTGELIFPQYSRTGQWRVTTIQLVDIAGNREYIGPGQIASLGFVLPTLEVTGLGDTTEPTVTGVSLDRTSFDTTGADVDLTLTLDATDDLSGVSSASATFTSPNRGQWMRFEITSFTDGSGSATMTFPRYSHTGTWTLEYLHVRDANGNSNSTGAWNDTIYQLGIAIPTIEVTGIGDVAPPTLSGLIVDQPVVDTATGDVSVDFSAEVTDDISGPRTVYVTFGAPPVSAWADPQFLPPSFTPDPDFDIAAELSSGDPSEDADRTPEASRLSPPTYATFTVQINPTDGTRVTFPQFSHPGVWRVHSLSLSDNVGNSEAYGYVQQPTGSLSDLPFELPTITVASLCAGQEATVMLAHGVEPTAGDDVILGTNGNDRIDGGAGDDIICGLDGRDVVLGGAGADELHGGPDRDRLFGQAGDDLMFGDSGIDQLRGGDGHDSLFGGEDKDTLWGHAGNDRLVGNAGNDVIWGNSGNDRISGGPGNDQVNAGYGEDRIAGNDGNDDLNGQFDNDLVVGGDGDDFLKGSTGDDVLWGQSGDDTLSGHDGADILHGGDGNDVLNGHGGIDELHAGAGIDTCRPGGPWSANGPIYGCEQ